MSINANTAIFQLSTNANINTLVINYSSDYYNYEQNFTTMDVDICVGNASTTVFTVQQNGRTWVCVSRRQ